MRLFIVIALFLTLWPSLIFAQSDTITKIDPSETRITLDYLSYAPLSEKSRPSWDFQYEERRGYPKYEFRGAWRYLTKEVKSRFSRSYRNQLNDFWRNSNDNNYSWNDYMSDLDEFETGGANFGWWNRSWTDSLPLEKGGAPVYNTIVYGREGDWIKIGPLILTHDLKFRISGTSIIVDGDQPIQDLKRKYLPEKIVDNKTVNIRADEEDSWLKSKLWKIRVKPSMNVRPFSGSGFFGIFRSASIKAEIQMFTSYGLHFANLECAARYDLQDQGFEIAAMFQLITW